MRTPEQEERVRLAREAHQGAAAAAGQAGDPTGTPDPELAPDAGEDDEPRVPPSAPEPPDTPVAPVEDSAKAPEPYEVDLFVADVNRVRRDIKTVAIGAQRLKFDAMREPQGRGVEDRGEVLANLTLAYRHLEDASMRLGKALQARDGGVSVYDRTSTVGA
jgi:hypothetical protein